jgi:DNA-directed RNA polymerase subunit RPC12/RpoP
MMRDEHDHKYYIKIKKLRVRCPMCNEPTSERVDINHSRFVYLCLDCARKEGYQD